MTELAEKSSAKWWEEGWRLAAVIFAVSCVLLSINLGRGFTVDEYTTWGTLALDWDELIENRIRNGHMPTYFVVVNAWVESAGDAEALMRLPSVVAVAFGIAVLAMLARRMFGPAEGVAVAVVAVLHQTVVWGAQNARPWGMIFAASACLGWCLWVYLETGRRRWLFVTGIVIICGMSIGMAYGMAVAGLAVATILAGRGRWKRTFAALGTIALSLAVLLVPVLMFAGRQEKYSLEGRTPAISLLRGLNGLADVMLGDHKIWTDDWARYTALLLFTVLACAFAAACRRRALAHGSPAGFLWAWMIVPWVCLTVGAGITRTSMLSHERYYLPLMPALLLIEAAGAVHLIRSRRPAWQRLAAPVAALALLATTTAVYWASDGDGPKVVARKMVESGEPLIAAGNVHPLRYEWRHRKDTTLMHFGGLEAEAVHAAWNEFQRTQGRAWLFIYDNKVSSLDEVVGWERNSEIVDEEISYRHARTVLLVPRGDASAQPE